MSPEREARFAAVYGIVAFVSCPYHGLRSAGGARFIHQIVSSEGMAITPRMLYTLFASLAAFTLVYATLLRQRIRLANARDRLELLRLAQES